jgi:uncharacterized membrane protein
VLSAIAIGFIAGLRAMLAPAVVSWTARLRWPQLQSTPLALMARPALAYLFTLLAIGELVVDKLPFTPSRTSAGPLTGRLVLGALSGAVLRAAMHRSFFIGAVLGAAGGLLGAYAGYTARKSLVTKGQLPDFVVALTEDVIAIGGALAIVSKL